MNAPDASPGLSPRTGYRLASDVRFRKVGGEGVVVQQSAGEVLVVNGVGARVLELLDPRREEGGLPAGRSLGELLQRLAEEYEAPRDRIERDVRGFLDEVTELGVVVAGAESSDF